MRCKNVEEKDMQIHNKNLHMRMVNAKWSTKNNALQKVQIIVKKPQ